MIGNKKTDRVSFLNVEDGRINITSHTDGECEVIVYSKELNSTFYTTAFTLQTNMIYFIEHPCFMNVDIVNIDFKFKDRTDTITLVSDDLKVQKKHILNYYTQSEYDLIKDSINWSYTEIVAWDHYKIMDLNDDFYNDLKVVVDLGANIGTFEKLILNKCPNLEKYIAVEPSPYLQDVIKKHNVNPNRVIYQRAFDSEIKDVNFNYHTNIDDSEKNFVSGSMDIIIDEGVYNGTTSVGIKTITLKEILNDNNWKIIDLLKVDIEGGEIHLYKGDNLNYMNRVKYIIVEAHSDEIEHEIINNLPNFEVVNINRPGFPHIFLRNKILTNRNPQYKKKILIKVSCPALGDILCSTPTIRKVAQSYGHKIDVMTKRYDVFKNNPYVENIIDYTESDPIGYDEVFETYNQYYKVNKNMGNESFYDTPIEVKLSNFEARQLHAMGVGISLYPDEMSYDFIADEQTEISKRIDKNYIVLHVTENWPVRTWPIKKWQELVDLIKEKTDYKIVTIGKAHQEEGYFGKIDKGVISLENIDIDTCLYENVGRQDHVQLGGGSLSELWHIINNAKALVSFDTGPIHLAGTTDTHIIQIGSSIRYEKTAPYRHGSQLYKFDFVAGGCGIFCASDPKYSVKEWGTINSMPYYPKCQEGFEEFKCQPTVNQVFEKIIELGNE